MHQKECLSSCITQKGPTIFFWNFPGIFSLRVYASRGRFGEVMYFGFRLNLYFSTHSGNRTSGWSKYEEIKILDIKLASELKSAYVHLFPYPRHSLLEASKSWTICKTEHYREMNAYGTEIRISATSVPCCLLSPEYKLLFQSCVKNHEAL